MSENNPPRLDDQQRVKEITADESPSTDGLQAEICTLENILQQPLDEMPRSDDEACRRIVRRVEQIGAASEAAQAAASPADDLPCQQIGHYKLLAKLGQGGMGAVYKARHTKLNKLVALKVLPADRLKEQNAVARFEREMRAVGQLDHVNIVAAHDAGEADGNHYLVMELVDGVNLSTLVRRYGPLPSAEACEVIRRAAEGLQHAHSFGMVHRDIKPGNVMLTFEGQVKILDMGLALLDEMKGPGNSDLTNTGQMMGTLDYMAPEQGTDSHQVDIRADVYSLGATLFKLITGEAPFQGPQHETPLGKMMALAVETPRTLAEVRDDVPPELSDIVARMLAKKVDERPPTPQDVIDLLAPFAAGAELSEIAGAAKKKVGSETDAPSADTFAHLPSSFTDTNLSPSAAPLASAVLSDTETIKRAVPAPAGQPPRRPRRRTVIAAAAAAALVLLGIFIIIRDRDGKEKLRIELQDGDSIEVVEKTAAVPKPDVPSRPVPPVKPTIWPADRLRRADIPAEEFAAAGGGDPSKAPPKLVAVLGDSHLRHWSDVLDVVFSPDGKTVYSGSGDGTVKAWDTSSGRSLHTFSHEYGIRSLALSSDGNTLFTSGHGKKVRRFDAVSGEPLETEIMASGNLAISPDGKLLAIGSTSGNGTVGLWDIATSKRLHTLEGHGRQVACVAFSPDGKILGSASYDQTIKLWDVASGKELRTLRGHRQSVDSVAFSPDGSTVASGSHDGTVRLWNVATGDERRTLQGRAAMNCVAFSPDGKMIAAGGEHTSEVIFWDVATGKELKRLTVSGHVVPWSIAFSPDGKTLVSGSQDGGVRLWDVSSGEQQFPRSYTPCLAVSSDGARLATGNHDGTLKVWNLATGREQFVAKVDEEEVSSVAFSPDGRIVAAGSRDYTLKFWDSETGRLLRTLKRPGNFVMSLAFTADGKTLASGSADKTIKLWDVATGQELPLTKKMAKLRGHTHDVSALCFSPDGATLASGDGRTVRLWDRVTGEQLHLLKGHDYNITSVAFSPDGRLLISSDRNSRDATVRLWDVATGEQRRTLKAPEGMPVLDATFSPDGKTIVSSNMDGTVRLWNPSPPLGESMLRETLRIGPARGKIERVVYSPEGRHLITLNGNGTIYVLRLKSLPGQDQALAKAKPPLRPIEFDVEPLSFDAGEPLSPWALVSHPEKIEGVPSWTLETAAHRGPVRSIRYSPDGKWLASCGDDANVRIWDAKTQQLLRIFVGASGGVAWSPDSRWVASGGPQQTIRLWDPASGRLVKTFGGLPDLRGDVGFLEWSPDGKLLAVMGEHIVGDPTVWDVASGRCLHKLSGSTPVNDTSHTQLKWSPDGAVLAFVSDRGFDGERGGYVRRWVLESQQYLEDLKHPGVLNVNWSPDGKSLISSDPDSKKKPNTRIWDNETGELKHSLQGVFFSPSPDGKLIATAEGTKVRLYDAESFELVREIRIAPSQNHVLALDWSPDAKTLALGTNHGDVQLWDAASGGLVSGRAGHPSQFYNFSGVEAWSPDQTRLVLSRSVFDVQSGECVQQKEGRAEGRHLWSPDGKMIVSRTSREVTIWDAKTGESLRSFAVDEGQSIACSPDGKWIATDARETIQIWDASSGKLLRTLKCPFDHYPKLRWSPDSKRLARLMGKDGGSIQIWDAASGQLLQTIAARHNYVCRTFAWSPDGKNIASCGNKEIRLWDSQSGDLIERLVGHKESIRSLRWSIDGKSLFSADGKEARQWGIESGARRAVIAPLGEFSPDGRFMACRRLGDNISLSVEIRETTTGTRCGTIALLRDAQPLSVSPAGHFRAPAAAARQLVYIIQTEAGEQKLLTPAEFAKRHGWKNDPAKVSLIRPVK